MRRYTNSVSVAHLKIGYLHDIAIQSMTDTDTADIAATVRQIMTLVEAGAEIIRVTVNNTAAALAVKDIKIQLNALGITTPVVGDFHFNGHKLLTEVPTCAQYLDKYRINPGNIGSALKKDIQFQEIINIAIKYHKPVRIGVNWGSLDQQLLSGALDLNSQQPEPKSLKMVMRATIVRSALESAAKAIEYGLTEDQIILSAKVSNVTELIAIYRDLAQKCNFPLHLGLTEAGSGERAIIASTAAIATLLQEGIGDTIRISLTPTEGRRTQEVTVAQDILQALELRFFQPIVTSCPGCGRTSSNYFQQLATEIQQYIAIQMPHWRNSFVGVETLKIAIMGCVVNGPGESKMVNIGISLPGRDEYPVAPVYIDGKKSITLKGVDIAAQFKQILQKYIETNYSSK